MSWNTETNLSPGAPDPSSQTNKSQVGFVEDNWTAGSYPCVRAEFDFTTPFDDAGGEGNIYLRRSGPNNWIRAQVKHRGQGRFDYSIRQNFGVDVSANPNSPILPWVQVQRSGASLPGQATVHSIIEDGSGGWYVAGEFSTVFDTDGTVFGTGYNSIIHILPDGSLDTNFQVSPNGFVYAMALSGGVLYIGGNFTQIDMEANHGGPFNRIALVGVDPSTGASTRSFNISSGTVRAIEVAGGGIWAGGNLVVPITFIGPISINLGRFNTSTGILTNAPIINGTVFALESDNDGLWVGGEFNTVQGNTSEGLFRINPDTSNQIQRLGRLLIGAASPPAGTPGRCFALKFDPISDTLYVGGEFDYATRTVAAPGPHFPTTRVDNAVSYSVQSDAYTLNTGWLPNPNNTVRSLELAQDGVMIGGEFDTLSGVNRNYVAELDRQTAEPTGWDPQIDDVVYAMLYDDNTSQRVIGGGFNSSLGVSRMNLSSYIVHSAAGIDDIIQINNIPLPPSKKLTLMCELGCGEKLKTYLMDGDTGRIIRFNQRVVSWADNRTARVEVGPAGTQGPRINSASLSEGDLVCADPEAGSYTACVEVPTEIEHFTVDHLPISYPQMITDTTYTAPRSWSHGVAGFNPPFHRPARWWHEIIEPDDLFLPGLTIQGDLTSSPNQFSHAWCLGIVDIRGFQSKLNSDDDPVVARWSNVLVAGNAITQGDTTLFEGLSVRIDFKKSAIAIGLSSGCGVNKRVGQRQFNTVPPGARDRISEGVFVPNFVDWTTLSNLDQWSNGISLAVSMSCDNELVVGVWGEDADSNSAKIGEISVVLDPINQDGVLNSNLLGNAWGCFSYMEGANLSLLDDEENSKIVWNLLTADLDGACGE